MFFLDLKVGKAFLIAAKSAAIVTLADNNSCSALLYGLIKWSSINFKCLSPCLPLPARLYNKPKKSAADAVIVNCLPILLSKPPSFLLPSNLALTSLTVSPAFLPAVSYTHLTLPTKA